VSAAVAAFFDVDGTLTRSTVVEPLVWYQRAHLPRWLFAPWAAVLAVQIPQYWLLDKWSRGRFNVVFYRRYRGLPVDEVCRWHRETFAQNLQRRVFPAALECLRGHREQGHRVVLLTGALDCVMQPLADFVGADDLIAMRLRAEGGVFTGELTGPPIAGEQKAVLVRGYARMHGIDLGQSFVYGDSKSDIPVLACAGHPVAVRPGRRLRGVAAARGWRVVEWSLEG
jgi:HAD superfamily hydrolase (TIGR01490 family)